ncbi:MAG: glutamate racemase [Pyrinomonadaceae bacterium]|nr:glutamate racemase [Pyrinomonadaceae bacterium]
MTLKNNLPIGIFDSGVGGLTVYRSLHKRLPDERFLYLGDTARVPYGTKSLSTVERYGIENARFLAAHGIKMLVVACNTASALALPAIERAAGVPTVGVIESGARAAVEQAKTKIGVIATEATVRSGAYRRAIERRAPHVNIIEQACPLFVSLAEEGYAETEAARIIANDYLKELRAALVDALVIGCTHYPVLRKVIEETIGEGVMLIDSGEAVAEDTAAALETHGLGRAPDRENLARPRRLCDDLDHFYVTDSAERFSRIAEMFLGSAPRRLEAVEVWGHDQLNAGRKEN